MKVNELMIGNWVKIKGDYGKPLKITTIDDTYNSINYFDGDAEGELTLQLNEIEPIPLTPEILEKNGFVENRGVTSWKFETDREDLIDIYGVKDYHLSINIKDTHGSGKGYRWILYNLTIFYVHQLQHALRLFGIDKTIEL